MFSYRKGARENREEGKEERETYQHQRFQDSKFWKHLKDVDGLENGDYFFSLPFSLLSLLHLIWFRFVFPTDHLYICSQGL
jgi:hypothetical protein